MKYFVRIIQFALTFTLCSCKKDFCDGREEQKLEVYALDAVPYQNGDNPKFLSSDGEVITLSVQRKFDVSRPDAPLICDDLLEIYMTNTNTGQRFAEILMRGSTSSELIQIIIFHEYIIGPIVQMEAVEEDVLTKFYLNDNVAEFFNELLIDTITYQNVLKLTYPLILDAKAMKEFYYNAEFGVLKIVTNDKFTLTRI